MKRMRIRHKTTGATFAKQGDQAAIDAWIDQMRIDYDYDNDFETLEDVDVTAEATKETKLLKLKTKKEMANDVLIYINYVIRDLTMAEKQTLLARTDIQGCFAFLEKGSIVDSMTIAQSLTTDTLLTEAMKTEVTDYLQSKIDEYNAKSW
jgi:hypothetical protein